MLFGPSFAQSTPIRLILIRSSGYFFSVFKIVVYFDSDSHNGGACNDICNNARFVFAFSRLFLRFLSCSCAILRSIRTYSTQSIKLMFWFWFPLFPYSFVCTFLASTTTARPEITTGTQGPTTSGTTPAPGETIIIPSVFISLCIINCVSHPAFIEINMPRSEYLHNDVSFMKSFNIRISGLPEYQ